LAICGGGGVSSSAPLQSEKETMAHLDDEGQHARKPCEQSDKAEKEREAVTSQGRARGRRGPRTLRAHEQELRPPREVERRRED